MDAIKSELIKKIKILNESIWERRASQLAVDNWLDNFDDDEKIMSLFLLSNFMFFGSLQMRELMSALYRDLYKTPIIHKIRRDNGDTMDSQFINDEFSGELQKTKFIGIGNPSESGCHLLYYLRQENSLSKEVFSHTHELFERTGTAGHSGSLRYPELSRYVFIDDFCGTGGQTATYLKSIVEEIKTENPDAILAYYVLFATTDGLKHIRTETSFDHVESVIELDPTFKVFDPDSRFFKNEKHFDKVEVKAMCESYGIKMYSDAALGYGNCQLLIGFHHNVPDNTLPVIWFNGIFDGTKNWAPIFKRYQKIY